MSYLTYVNSVNAVDKFAGIKLALESLGVPFVEPFEPMESSTYGIGRPQDRGTDRVHNCKLTFVKDGVTMVVEQVYLVVDDTADCDGGVGDVRDIIVYPLGKAPVVWQYVIEYHDLEEASYVQVVHPDGHYERVAELAVGGFDWYYESYKFFEMPLGTRQRAEELNAKAGSRV